METVSTVKSGPRKNKSLGFTSRPPCHIIKLRNQDSLQVHFIEGIDHYWTEISDPVSCEQALYSPSQSPHGHFAHSQFLLCPSSCGQVLLAGVCSQAYNLVFYGVRSLSKFAYQTWFSDTNWFAMKFETIYLWKMYLLLGAHYYVRTFLEMSRLYKPLCANIWDFLAGTFWENHNLCDS